MDEDVGEEEGSEDLLLHPREGVRGQGSRVLGKEGRQKKHYTGKRGEMGG